MRLVGTQSGAGYNRSVLRSRSSRIETPERILVVLPSWVGDFVMATPTIRALRQRYEDARIVLLGRPILADLIAGGGWADEVLHWEPKGRHRRWGGLLRLAAHLRGGGFDWAVLLTNSFRSALLARLARIPRRIGYDRDGRGWLLTDRLPVKREPGGEIRITRMVDYYGRLAECLGCDPPGDRMELIVDGQADAAIRQRLANEGVTKDARLVVLSPGASFGASKLWPPNRYAELADRLVKELGARIVITCAPGEESIAEQIGAKMARPACVLADPPTTLAEFTALVARCALWVGNDAGARHVAKALGRPVVTVFGPTDPGWTDTEYPQERKVLIPVDCGPCQKKVCPFDHHKCMTGISVEMMFAAASDLLEGRPGGSEEGLSERATGAVQ